MTVPVMQIGIMRVTVHQRRMNVPMRVRLAAIPAVVGMLVMRVVHV